MSTWMPSEEDTTIRDSNPNGTQLGAQGLSYVPPEPFGIRSTKALRSLPKPEAAWPITTSSFATQNRSRLLDALSGEATSLPDTLIS